MRAVALLIVSCTLCVPLLPRGAAADDDWNIKRERRAPRKPPPRRTPKSTRPARPDADAPRDADGARARMLMKRYRRVLTSKPDDTFALRRLMDLYRERDGNVDALIDELEEERAEDAEAYAPRLLLGHVYALSRRMDEAEDAYAEASSVSPSEPAPRRALARLRRDAGDLDGARRSFERALEHTSAAAERREVLRELGEVALDQGDHDAARRYYDRLSKGADSVYLRTELARALEARGAHEKAVDEYRRILRQLGGDRRVHPPVLRDLGRALLEAGRTGEAIDALDRALRLAPAGSGVRREIYDVMVDAHRRGGRLSELARRLEGEARGFESVEMLGRVHDELGNEEEALKAYRRALRMNPRHTDTRVRMIQLLSRSGQIEQVIEEYRALIRLSPRQPRFVVELAQLLMQVGRRDEAMRLAERTRRRHPREPSVHRALAELYGRWGEDELARRAVENLVRIEPRDPHHLIVLGAQKLAEGDREAAIATWRRILRTDPDKARAHATLGGVFADHDMLDEAEEAYRQAVRLESDDISHLRGLAGVLERIRERERRVERQARDAEAIKLWSRVLELAASDRAAQREARQRIVAIAARRDELSHRIGTWRKAFAAEPPDVDAGRFLVEAYLRQRPRKLDEAEQVLARIAEHAPGDIESLAALERVRTAQGDLDGAIEVLERLVDADPRKAPRYLSRMAEHALAMYRDEDAIRYAEMAVERTPDDASAHRRLGDLYRARQDADGAVASYRRAIDLDERKFATYFDLAELHLARGDVREADLLLRRVMRASPDDDLVARAVRAAMQIHRGAGTLQELERDLLPLALAHPRRPVFRRLVVELHDALARPWILEIHEEGADAEEAAEHLGRLGQRALKPMLEALGDKDPAQRRIAVSLLGHLGNPNAAGPLLAAAENAKMDADLRVEALAAAGALASSRDVSRFAALARGPERRLRATAAWSLARIGGRRAVKAMRGLLAHPDPAVRAYAAVGLARAGDAQSAEHVAQMARDDRNAHARAAALLALGWQGQRKHVPLLVVALGGRPGPVSRAAAAALGRMGGRRSAEALAHAVFDSDPVQRGIAMGALVRLRTEGPGDRTLPVPESADAIDRYLEALMARPTDGQDVPSPDMKPLEPLLREAAAEALHGAVERVQVALAAMTPVDPEGGDEAADAATELSDQWPRSARAWAGRLGLTLAQALVPELVAVADHPDVEVRERVLRILSHADDPAVARALREALEDPEVPVLRAALEGLAQRHGDAVEGVGPEVVRLLEHREWPVRMEAARTLGRLGDPALAEALVHVLRRDRFAFVREAAAVALGRLGTAEARAALSRARADDPEPRVRRAARAAFDASPSD